MQSDRNRLDRRILDIIERGWGDPPSDLEFEEIALDLFRYQFDSVEPYHRLCESRSRRPESDRSTTFLPARWQCVRS